MSSRTLEGVALTELVLEIFRINGAMLDAGNRITAPHGLTSARWQVLGAIDLAGQPLTVSQIARRMGLARQGVQRIINDLDKLGMVTASDNLDHKRAPLFSISKSGAKILMQIDKAQIKWINELSGGFSAGKLSQALNLLQAIRERSNDLEI